VDFLSECTKEENGRKWPTQILLEKWLLNGSVGGGGICGDEAWLGVTGEWKAG